MRTIVEHRKLQVTFVILRGREGREGGREGGKGGKGGREGREGGREGREGERETIRCNYYSTCAIATWWRLYQSAEGMGN